MNVQQLINNHVRFCFRHIYPVTYTDNTMSFRFSLPIAATVNDKDLIKTTNQQITYARNVKKDIIQYKVNLTNVTQPYPKVSNSKHFSDIVTFNLSDLVKQLDLKYFFSQEYEKLFRELKSELILQEIGKLTQKWNDVSSGKYPQKERAYGETKFSFLTDHKLRNISKELDNLPF